LERNRHLRSVGRAACVRTNTPGATPSNRGKGFLSVDAEPGLSLSAVTDAPAADRAAGLRLRPSSQPHRRVPATADVGVEAQEDGHANVLVVLIDLDVVETIYDPVKELDSERLIIRLDIYPIPRGRPEVSAIRVRNRRISTGRPPKKSFRLALGNSSHAPSSTNGRCERQRAPRSARQRSTWTGLPHHDRARRMDSWSQGLWQSLPAGNDILFGRLS
jgi:hypothetical protein